MESFSQMARDTLLIINILGTSAWPSKAVEISDYSEKKPGTLLRLTLPERAVDPRRGLYASKSKSKSIDL